MQKLRENNYDPELYELLCRKNHHNSGRDGGRDRERGRSRYKHKAAFTKDVFGRFDIETMDIRKELRHQLDKVASLNLCFTPDGYRAAMRRITKVDPQADALEEKIKE